ncbi:hypothetical protein ACSLUB_11355 [Bordetella hinzii]|uniref:hypothetical protein n=1 Tax=Bordetella hinzii TaxID=103855 RepID=UPI003F1AFFCD
MTYETENLATAIAKLAEKITDPDALRLLGEVKRLAAPGARPAAGDALDSQAAVRSLQRYGFGYADDGNGARYLSSLKRDDGAFLRRDEVLAALAAQAPHKGDAA